MTAAITGLIIAVTAWFHGRHRGGKRVKSFFQVVHMLDTHAVAVRCSMCQAFFWRGSLTQAEFLQELSDHQEEHDRASGA